MSSITYPAAQNINNNGPDPPIPKDLIGRSCWVFWRWKEHDGEPTKVLYNPHNNQKADTTDPDTWGTFECAVRANEEYEGDGIGIVFSEDDTLAGVDLDGCIDLDTGELHSDAQAIIDELNSYTEVSPSGTGVKVFVHALKPGSRCRTNKTPWGDHIEMYDQDRFFTVTGNRVPGTRDKVYGRQKALTTLYGRFFGSEPAKTAVVVAPYIGLSDDEVIAKARSAKNGEKFYRLFDWGDIGEYGDNDSDADAGLAGILVFYTGCDVDQAARIMRQSTLYRDKYERSDYLPRTIEFVLSNQTEFYGHAGVKSVKILSNHHSMPLEQKELESDDGHIHSSLAPRGNEQKGKLEFLSVQDLMDVGGDEPEWIVRPYLARGWLTDLVGPAKLSGKTTLITHIGRCVLDGKPFLCEPTTKTNIVYLTEQGNNILEPLKKAGLGTQHDGLRILPWRATRGWSWPDIVDAAVAETKQVGADLLVVDTVNRFAGLKGEEENNAGHVAAAMNPLLEAAQTHNIAVLSIRHANKEGRARGSTQFDHDVDILLTLNRPDANLGDNARVLKGVGRSDLIPAKQTIELTDDGYISLGDDDNVKFKQAVRAIKHAASTDPDNPTNKTDLEETLDSEWGISKATTQRALHWLCEPDQDGLVRVGKGVKGSPFAYYQPSLTVELQGERVGDPDEAA